MKRLLFPVLVGLAGLLAGCGSSRSSSTTAKSNELYSFAVSPTQLTLNSGDFASISAVVFLSTDNGTPKAVSPQPAIKFFSSDARVTVSPAGEVCAGLWDSRYLTCTATPTLPGGFVTITALDTVHRNKVNDTEVPVTGTVQVSVHKRAVRITLSSDWAGRTCISQNQQVQYLASAVDANGHAIPSCTPSSTPGCIHDNDYTWSTESTAIAQASTFGFVAARNPGVTNVFATLNGTVSEPLAFVTCPPSSIVLSTSTFTGTTPAPPFTTDDLTLNKGDQKYANATLIDKYGNSLVTSPLTYISSDPLVGSLAPALALSAKLTANSAGRFTMMAACEPASCNPAVANFLSPAGPQTSQSAGFGYPIYSNVIGATVQGITASSVLVTGKKFADDVTLAHRLLVLDSESMVVTHTIALANSLPNSLVVAPNGAAAYVGSSAGLMVVDLSTFQSSVRTYPVTGQPNTAVITGTVLGVSPDSRYVVVSDVANEFVFLIDTTGTKAATRYNIPHITSATFAADGTNIWIGSNPPPGALDSNGLPDNGRVFVFEADTFVPIPTNASSHVTSLAWMPDGQSYFASGDQMVDYSTCENQVIPPSPLGPVSSVQGGLSTTAIDGVPHLLGIDVNTWFNYSVTTGAQVGSPNGTGNVCLGLVTPPGVTVNGPATTAAVPALPCDATQVSFAPKLEEAFVTGVGACATSEAIIHGYNALTNSVVNLNLANPVVPLSGDVLNDGRKLYFGTFDSATQSAVLHRIDLATGSEDVVPSAIPGAPPLIPAAIEVVPDFVAVVPK